MMNAEHNTAAENPVEPARLTVIVPVLNEVRGIVSALSCLQTLRARGHEVIVVDGGSSDGTPDAARPFADRVLNSPRGRARQMNTGARAARGDVLLFLHADTALPADADRLIVEAFRRSGRMWGRFDVELSPSTPPLRLVAFLMNLRSRLTGIATGDQAMFVRRVPFERIGGFPALALMEDIALSIRLKRESRPVCLRPRAVTSSRKWEREGIVRTVLLMWRLRLAFFFGADSADLARRYYGGREP